MADILDVGFEPNLKAEHIERLKQQERIAIKGYLSIQRARIAVIGSTLDTSLTEVEEQMKTISNHFAQNIEGGLTGTAGDAARTYLTELKKPNLQNPIQ